MHVVRTRGQGEETKRRAAAMMLSRTGWDETPLPVACQTVEGRRAPWGCAAGAPYRGTASPPPPVFVECVRLCEEGVVTRMCRPRCGTHGQVDEAWALNLNLNPSFYVVPCFLGGLSLPLGIRCRQSASRRASGTHTTVPQQKSKRACGIG